MSLVAYADSDEDSSDNESSEDVSLSAGGQDRIDNDEVKPVHLASLPVLEKSTTQSKLQLPAPSSASAKPHTSVPSKATTSDDGDSKPNSLLAGLPASTAAHKPGPRLSATEDELEDIVKPHGEELSLRQLPAKKREPVKIILPSLAVYSDDSDDDDGKKAKRRKNMFQKSSLLSSLPPPEHVTNLTSLIPQSLSKAAATMKSKTLAPQSIQLTKPVVESTRTLVPSEQASSARNIKSRLSASSAAVSTTVIDDSDDEASADFFSLDAATVKPTTYSAAFKVSESDDVRWSGATPRVEPTTSNTFVSPDVDNVSAGSADMVWNATNYTSPVTDFLPISDTAVNNEPEQSGGHSSSQDFKKNFQDPEFQKAFGKHGPKGEIKVINVHLDEVLSGVDVTKNLPNDAEPMMSHSKKRNKDMPSSQQKRKHQISFLAFRAKERELELKNQWAENKFNKRQTQSKYGF